MHRRPGSYRKQHSGNRAPEVEISVPSEFVSRIIGPGGAHMKALQTRPGVRRVWIEQRGDAPMFQGWCDHADAADELRKHVLSILHQRPGSYRTQQSGNRAPDVEISVPSEFVSRIIGPGGVHIKALQTHPGVRRVWIERGDAPMFQGWCDHADVADELRKHVQAELNRCLQVRYALCDKLLSKMAQGRLIALCM